MIEHAPEPRGTVFVPSRINREMEHVLIAAFVASREDALNRLHLNRRAADYKAVGDAKAALAEVLKVEVSHRRARDHLVKLQIIQPAQSRDTVLPQDLFIASRVEELLGGAADPLAILRWATSKHTPTKRGRVLKRARRES